MRFLYKIYKRLQENIVMFYIAVIILVRSCRMHSDMMNLHKLFLLLNIYSKLSCFLKVYISSVY